MVSPEQAQPLANRHVLIRDGRIVSVGQQRIAAKADTQKIDGRGKFLTPGLMDSHVHVSDAAGVPPLGDEPELVALREAYFRQQPRSYLYFGVTQVLDLMAFANGLKTFESQPVRPDLFHCGAAPVLDGYPTAMLPQAVRYQAFPDYVYEPANAKKHPLPAGANEAEHTPEALVERAVKGGARCMKIFIEDGFGPSSDWPLMSKETLARFRAATRKHNLPLLAHANALDMQRIALDAGVDVHDPRLVELERVRRAGRHPRADRRASAQDSRERHRLSADAARAARNGGYVSRGHAQGSDVRQGRTAGGARVVCDRARPVVQARSCAKVVTPPSTRRSRTAG